MSATVYTRNNPHLWLVEHLSDEERARRILRADKRCTLGHAHDWAFELNMDIRQNTGWVRCGNCAAITWDGVDS